jgi:hypothetical protein
MPVSGCSLLGLLRNLIPETAEPIAKSEPESHSQSQTPRLLNRWNHTRGRWLLKFHRRRRQKRSASYYAHQEKPLTPIARDTPRKLSLCVNSDWQIEARPYSLENKLLSLPAEVRTLIWEHAFGGHLIAIYRDNGRLTHTVLDENNATVCANDMPVRLETIKKAVMYLPGGTTQTGRMPQVSTKLNILALLQCCRTM